MTVAKKRRALVALVHAEIECCHFYRSLQDNWLFPSCLLPWFPNESSYKTIHIKMCSAHTFISFHVNHISFSYEKFCMRTHIENALNISRHNAQDNS